MENVSSIILALVAAAIPVVIILTVLYRIRRKREDSSEKTKRENSQGVTDKLKSVKESRMEEKGLSNNS